MYFKYSSNSLGFSGIGGAPVKDKRCCCAILDRG
nr:MAG TPA: hypothetical protein [Inoviridae sp.]